ncbi:MAG: V-type ATPase 116kDa subunit family protein, partial [Spirochaetales bacterium]|nr:V-type ATPase 116kDa subunit family protein [Spirochaetales bacterium]
NQQDNEIKTLRLQLESIYKNAEIELPDSEDLKVEQITSFSENTAEEIIDKINIKINKLRESQKKLHQESLKISEVYENLKNQTDKNSKKSSFILIHKGYPGRGSFDEMLESFRTIPHAGYQIPESNDYIFICLKRDRSLVESNFRRYEWIEKDDSLISSSNEKNILKNIEEEIKKLTYRKAEVKKQIKELVIQNKNELDNLWKFLRTNELYSIVRNKFSYTGQTVLFSGWLPSSKAYIAEKAIKKASDNRCIIEWSEDKKFDRKSIPVETKYSKRFEPFEMIVENYGTPEYGTVDPTILVSITFMIMFGLMFADSGQGLVIMLIGALGLKFMPKMKKLMTLFIYCGTASVITGLLFGSFFGYQLIPALWFDYHSVVNGHGGSGAISSIYDILKITIYFGIAVIFSGLLLNWINLYRKRDYFKLFLDKSGILGGWIYGGGIYASFYFVSTGYKELPAGNILTIFFGIPVIIIFFKEPIHYFAIEKKREIDAFKIIDFIMEWIVELLEIFSGYLANTLSFMRVAGLGIAHVSLMTAFDSISKMTNGVGAIIILVIGNIIVIALEGLSAGIQALRLNYYEFFSRYFTGKGIAYNPVSLRNRKLEG